MAERAETPRGTAEQVELSPARGRHPRRSPKRVRRATTPGITPAQLPLHMRAFRRVATPGTSRCSAPLSSERRAGCGVPNERAHARSLAWADAPERGGGGRRRLRPLSTLTRPRWSICAHPEKGRLSCASTLRAQNSWASGLARGAGFGALRAAPACGGPARRATEANCGPRGAISWGCCSPAASTCHGPMGRLVTRVERILDRSRVEPPAAGAIARGCGAMDRGPWAVGIGHRWLDGYMYCGLIRYDNRRYDKTISRIRHRTL